MATILTPINLAAATKVGGRLWRKQILPEGSINYKGRRIDFTGPKLQSMVRSFDRRAFDSVPLVLADADNRHTMDPRAATGRVVDLEYVPGHGLDMLVRPDQQGEELLSRNPDVGVSARILEGYERADGEHFDAAIQHALITWDPRITGMKPWEVIGLSNDGDLSVIDMSEYQFVADSGDETPKEADMADKTTSPLTEAEWATLRSLMAKAEGVEPTVETEAPTPTVTEPTKPEAEVEVTDEELERIATEALAALDSEPVEGEPATEPAVEKEPELVAAANDGDALELANARFAEQAVELANMRQRLDENAFEKERDRLAEKPGIPPYITELARPLLMGSHVIELSNGDSVDAGQVMRDVLKAVGDQVHMLDLSGQIGDRFGAEPDENSPESRAAQAKADRAALRV